MIWNEILGPVLASSKLTDLKQFIKEGRLIKNIYPSGKDVFRAFDMCQYEDTKIVILGQDPYSKEGQADGLAFSSRGPEIPKSLEVIFKEIYSDLNIQYFHNITYDEFFPTADLSNWTKMGILLLNTILTVEEGKPGSHKDMGWELVTEAVFEALNKKEHQVLFLLWGKEANLYKDLIKNPKHVYLEAAHPAAELHNPSGPKFSNCRHFSIVRDILPTINGMDIYSSAILDSCFDKEKAKEIIKEHYPLEAKQLCDFIEKDLIVHIPVNREIYYKELRNIEMSFNTKKKE